MVVTQFQSFASYSICIRNSYYRYSEKNMSFIEVLLLTLVNAAVCISLPKLLMLISSKNTQKASELDNISIEALAPEFSSIEATAELTSVSS